MNTIVLNTLTGAVSEYTGWGFQSVTPTQAGDALGLYTLGGDTDNGVLPIVAQVTTGKKQWGSSLRKMLGLVYFALKGSGTSTLTVVGDAATYSYPITIRPNAESRSQPGKGLREDYLAFGYSNADGADFQLDRIEVEVAASKTRRT